MNMLEENLYWTRMWILQEFALAQRQPLLLYGGSTLKSSLACIAWAKKDGGLVSEMKRTLQELGESPPSDYMTSMELEKIQDSVSHFGESVRFYHGASLHLGTREQFQQGDMTMSWLMVNTYWLRSSDVRDKVYALYSMVPDSYKLPKPKYDAPVDDILRSVVVRVIKTERSLRIYDWISPSRLESGFPSWTPDLSDVDECYKRWSYCFLRSSTFRRDGEEACGGMPASVSVSSDGLELVVGGFELDRITSVADIPSEDEPSQCPGLWDFVSKFQSIYAKPSKEDLEPDGSVRFQSSHSYLACILTELSQLREELDRQKPPRFVPHEIKDLRWAIRVRAASLVQSTLFITTKGYIGFSYHKHGVREGDVVAIFGGLDFPHVLRPWEGKFRMIGSAYVSGVMDGRFVSELASDGDARTTAFLIA